MLGPEVEIPVVPIMPGVPRGALQGRRHRSSKTKTRSSMHSTVAAEKLCCRDDHNQALAFPRHQNLGWNGTVSAACKCVLSDRPPRTKWKKKKNKKSATSLIEPPVKNST